MALKLNLLWLFGHNLLNTTKKTELKKKVIMTYVWIDGIRISEGEYIIKNNYSTYISRLNEGLFHYQLFNSYYYIAYFSVLPFLHP